MGKGQEVSTSELGGGITAGADLSSSQYRAVTIDGTGRTVTLCNAATEIVAGILQNAPASGQAATVKHMGVSKMVAGGAITRGNLLKVDVADPGAVVPFVAGTDGHDHSATPASAPPANTADEVVGIALEDAADGDVFTGLIRPQRF